MTQRKTVTTILTTLLLQWSMIVLAAQSFPPPQQEVESITRQLLTTFKNNAERYRQNDTVFLHEVDRQLSPVVAFDEIARSVMGRYARTATPTQIAQFSKVFKDSLISFYGKALLTLDDTRVSIERVDPVPESVLRDYQAGKSRLVPVHMTAKTSSSTIAITYSMIFVDGRWKLRNIIVDGINVGIQFRNQFAEAMNRYNNIQYVIDHWPQLMQGMVVEKPGKDT